MFQTAFVGRSRELETLDRLWASSRATLLILYGRRRVGKTHLVNTVFKGRQDFYLTGILINSFSFFAFITVMEILDWFKWNKISLEVKAKE